jgi:hypothetical protein
MSNLLTATVRNPRLVMLNEEIGLLLHKGIPMSREECFDFKVLIKFEDGLWIAHCLELDIVASARTPEQVQEEIVDLISAQVSYAIENNNMENLYHSAPADVWMEYFGCSNRRETVHPVRLKKAAHDRSRDIRPLISTSTCFFESSNAQSAAQAERTA